MCLNVVSSGFIPSRPLHPDPSALQHHISRTATPVVSFSSTVHRTLTQVPLHVTRLAGAFIQSEVQIVHVESKLEHQGSEVHSCNCISMVRVK